MKIVVVASLAWSLTNFRGALLAEMIAAGHEVVACAPEAVPENLEALRVMGVRYRQVPMARTGTNIFSDLRTLGSLVHIFRDERPDLVLAYTQKPIIYAGIAARLVGGIAFHAMVSGLGHVFTDVVGLRRQVLRRSVARLYRIGIARAKTVFVFNADDAPEMARHGIIDPAHRVVQVPGSGVDTCRFPHVPVPSGRPTFLLVARLLRNKGLQDYAAAAAKLKSKWPEARFLLLGPRDANPECISSDELRQWVASGLIEYLGETRNVAPFLAKCTVFVLPSWYREGLPRTILEAMSTGRAIITTDMPGCREPITDGLNGLIVPPRDPAALAQAMATFLVDQEQGTRMGAASRQIAETQYDVRLVNALLLDTMGLSRHRSVPESFSSGDELMLVRVTG